MHSPSNFTEWTPEQKKEYAEKRMREMKSKNEMLMKRYNEVENDRKQAESRNSAITNIPKSLKKESGEKPEIKKEYSREWDRGKPDSMDSWDLPEHSTYFKHYQTGHRGRDVQETHKYWKSAANSRNKNYDDYNRFHESPKMTSHARKKNTHRAHSRSPTISESDVIGSNIPAVSMSSTKSSALWQNDKVSENRNKQQRLEKWVKSVSKSFPSDQKGGKKRFSKFDRYEQSSGGSSSEGDSMPHKAKCTDTRTSVYNARAGMQTKHNPQDSLNSSSKNPHVRKRRVFDNSGYKNFASCEKSANEKRFPMNKASNFANVTTFRVTDDSWEPVVNSKDDNNWDNIKQSDIKWKLSDEEANVQSKNLKQCNPKKSSTSNVSHKGVVKAVHSQDRDRVDTHIHQSHESRKLDRNKTRDEWKGDDSRNLIEISERLKKSCNIKDKMDVDEEKNFGSDGWSTVSEEGEIHTEDEDAEWKK